MIGSPLQRIDVNYLPPLRPYRYCWSRLYKPRGTTADCYSFVRIRKSVEAYCRTGGDVNVRSLT